MRFRLDIPGRDVPRPEVANSANPLINERTVISGLAELAAPRCSGVAVSEAPSGSLTYPSGYPRPRRFFHRKSPRLSKVNASPVVTLASSGSVTTLRLNSWRRSSRSGIVASMTGAYVWNARTQDMGSLAGKCRAS